MLPNQIRKFVGQKLKWFQDKEKLPNFLLPYPSSTNHDSICLSIDAHVVVKIPIVTGYFEIFGTLKLKAGLLYNNLIYMRSLDISTIQRFIYIGSIFVKLLAPSHLS
jgi:hypothetical protein